MSTPLKRGPKPKFLAEDLDTFMAEAKYTKEPKTKKTQKRQSATVTSLDEEEDISESVGNFQSSAKKSKLQEDSKADTGNLVRGKIVDVMENQIKTRKHSNDQLLKNLSQVIAQVKEDNAVMRNNHQKLQQVSTALIKCMEQATTAQESNLKTLNEIKSSFKKQCEEIEADHKEEAKKMADELESDIQKLQQKLVKETRRSGWETLQKSIFHAMQNDF